MVGLHGEYSPGTLVEWHAAFVEHLLEQLNVHDIADDATPEMQLNWLQRELETRGVLSSRPVTEDDIGRTEGYRLVHCDELFRAKLPEPGTGRELSLYVATLNDHFFLASHLTDEKACNLDWEMAFVPASRGQWYGRADRAVARAAEISGFHVDSTSLVNPERSRGGQLYWQPKSFGTEPAECLWEMGFWVDTAISGRLFAAMNYMFLSEPGREDESWFLPRRFAAVGPMLAVWRDTPPLPGFSNSMIVCLSIDDSSSQDLAQQMTILAARRGVRLVVIFALGRWSSGIVNAVDLETTLEAAMVTTPEARYLVVHRGIAFDSNTVAYRVALSALRQRHPSLLLATEALPSGASGELHGIVFDQPSETDFILELLTL
jgi:hypothetical protein